jgi:alpha-L-fucosidase 2
MKKLIILISILLINTTIHAQSNDNPTLYEIWDDRPAQNRGADYSISKPGRGFPFDADWEGQSYPIGNGYMGANIFGRTDTERIQITEKTLANEDPYRRGGLTNFAEIYLDINHHSPENYRRSLNLNDGILYVSYMQDGVTYTREYLASYPENIIAVKLSASEQGKVSFTLSAEIPYLRSINESNTRTGDTRAENDLITLAGNIAYFSLNYEAQIKVINEGGELFAENDNQNAEIRVVNANSVVLLINADTNYELTQNLFLEETKTLKLDSTLFPHSKVSERIHKATAMGYDAIKESHMKDYQELFTRVAVSLSPEVPNVPTRVLLENYKQGITHPYLEGLIFQFGRFLLISSSRKGAMPTGLQGVWSQYEVTPWSGGYWHNINVQMNYWGAFNTNLAETFEPYLEYYEAYRPVAEVNATEYVRRNNPDALDANGENGWAIGTGASAYAISSPGGHSGPGTGGFTTKLFWDRYEFTQDTAFLREIAYPSLLSMSKFLSKTLKPAENGLLLVDPSASPEIRLKDESGAFRGEHYITTGTTFDQGFIWETYNDLLKAAGILNADDEFLNVARDQINHLDPILIGASGQVKEYREESQYGEIGDPQHRHISHLCPLFPGTLINSNTPDWLKAASVTLDYRGNNATGWGLAHRMTLRARTKDAEKTYEVFSTLLKEKTAPNLWTIHPPFQIDANLGLVAGVAEMLLQSHEGFIEILPALPLAWKTGSFSGLVARGNFEIAAQWEDMKAGSVNITSKSGGKCTLKYPNIRRARVTNASGDRVTFNREGRDVISFKTVKGEMYFVSLRR